MNGSYFLTHSLTRYGMSQFEQQTRGFSLIHQSVFVSFDFNHCLLDGCTELLIQPLAEAPLSEIRLNAHGLEILSVKINDEPVPFTLKEYDFLQGLSENQSLESLRKGGMELRQKQLESFLELEKGELIIQIPNLESLNTRPLSDPFSLPSASSSLRQGNDAPIQIPLSKEISPVPSEKKEDALFSPLPLSSHQDPHEPMLPASQIPPSPAPLPIDNSIYTSKPPSSSPAPQPLLLFIEYRVAHPYLGAVQFSQDKKFFCVRISSMPKPASACSAEWPLYGCAREWVPCLDRLYEKCTWDLFFNVSEYPNKDPSQAKPPIVISSGTCLSEEDGLYHFHIETPMSAPLIAVAAGTFELYAIPIPPLMHPQSNHINSDSAIDASLVPKAIHIYFFPCYRSLIQHSCHIPRALLTFFSDTFGKYPFLEYELHRMVFCPNLASSSFPHGAGLSFLDQGWLCSSKDCEKTLDQRRILMQTLAYQWFGCWILPKTWSDYWCILGLAQFMASCFYRCHFGNNEYQYRLKKDFQRLAALDVHMPPLHYVPHTSMEFLHLKSALVVYALDRKMAKVAASSGITLCIQKILKTSPPLLSANGFQRYVRKETSVDGLRTFWDQWVHGSGVPKLEFTYSQNNGRQVIEFDLVQENTSLWGRAAGMRAKVFTGAITVSIYEIDGVVYTHNLDVARSIQHFEVRFNSRYKYKKMLVKQAAGPSKKDEDNWMEAVKDDGALEQHRWIQWVWVDPDAEWPCPVILKQPDFKWARLVHYTPSIHCQFDALSHLREFPSLRCAQLLFKLASDNKLFHRIRTDAVNALVACAIPDLNWIGFDYLQQLLQRYTTPFSKELLDVMPHPPSFQNLQEYHVFKAVISAFASIKNELGHSPQQVKRMILNALKFCDSSQLGVVSESEYLSFFIQHLCRAMLILPFPSQRHREALFKAQCATPTPELPLQPTAEPKPASAQPSGLAASSEELDLGFGFLSDAQSDADPQDDLPPPSGGLKGLVESRSHSSLKSLISISCETVGPFQLSFGPTTHLIQEALELLEHVRIMELMTSCNEPITIACIFCLCNWMMAGLIDVEYDIFLEYSDVSFSSQIRQMSIQCLYFLQAYEHDFITTYLLQLIQDDPSHIIQRKIPRYFLATAYLFGAHDKGSLKGKRLIRFEKYKEFTLKWLPRLKLILEDTHLPKEVCQELLDWIDLMLSPPMIRVKVKWSAANLGSTSNLPHSSKEPSNPSLVKSWHPPYKGIPPTKRLGQPNASLLNAGISVVECLKFHAAAGPFLTPVPHTVVGYYDVIKDPMDLSCLEKRLKNGHYPTLPAMFEDLQKIFQNCYVYNADSSDICQKAKQLEAYFQTQVRPYAEKMIPPHRPMEISDSEWRKIRKVIRKVRERSSAVPFLKPVRNVPRYYDQITHPMDLGTIRKKVENKEYPTLSAFEADMRILFNNCFTFNNPKDETYQFGKELYDFFLKEWRSEFPALLKHKSGSGSHSNLPLQVGSPHDHHPTDRKRQVPTEELIIIEDDHAMMHSTGNPLHALPASPPAVASLLRDAKDPLEVDEDPTPTRFNHLHRSITQSSDTTPNSNTRVGVGLGLYPSTPTKRALMPDSHESSGTPKKIRIHTSPEHAGSPTPTPQRVLASLLKESAENINSLATLTHVHELLVAHPESFDFRIPVDPLALNIPMYPQIIKNPMDLQTIGKKLSMYTTHMDFFKDVRLMLNNAITFNHKESPVYISSHLFYKYVQELWRIHFHHSDFPPLAPHPIEKRTNKKQTSSAPSSLSVSATATSLKPVVVIPNAPTFTISLSKLNPVASTSKPNVAPKLSSSSHALSGLSSLKITLPSLPEMSPTFNQNRPMELSSPSLPPTPTPVSFQPPTTAEKSPLFDPPKVSATSAPPKPEFPLELQALEMTPERLAICMHTFEKMRQSKYATPFLRPVDPVLDGVLNYFDIVHHPMDFGTIHQRLLKSCYATVGDFGKDVLLVFQNCMDFNGLDHPYSKQAKLLKQPFLIDLKSMLPPLDLPLDVVKASKLLEKLKQHKSASSFLHPVDTEALQIPTYYDVIDYPMDFQTITRKLFQQEYTRMYSFFSDVRYIFYNCFKFNAPGHLVFKEGKELQKYFENEVRKFKLVSLLKLPFPLNMAMNDESAQEHPPPSLNAEGQENPRPPLLSFDEAVGTSVQEVVVVRDEKEESLIYNMENGSNIAVDKKIDASFAIASLEVENLSIESTGLLAHRLVNTNSMCIEQIKVNSADMFSSEEDGTNDEKFNLEIGDPMLISSTSMEAKINGALEIASPDVNGMSEVMRHSQDQKEVNGRSTFIVQNIDDFDDTMVDIPRESNAGPLPEGAVQEDIKMDLEVFGNGLDKNKD